MTSYLYERGTALSGLEFGTSIPGQNNADFFAPVLADFQYIASKGFSIVRLSFMWERIQPTLFGVLDPTYKSYIDQAVIFAKQTGLRLILDVHNYGRYVIYSDGGITEPLTETPTSIQYPYADYTQSGNIVLRNYGQATLGTFNNSVSPATGYAISFNMKFNSRDDTFGGEGLQIKPMWQSDTNCYVFNADLADSTWNLKKIVAGVTTTLASGTKVWGTTNTYAVSIDVNQAANGAINISVNGTPLIPTNTIASDLALRTGKIAFYPQGVHVRLDTISLNVNGDTTNGGLHQYVVGNSQLPITAFADLWSKLATAYSGESAILMYDLMNEWHDMPIPLSPSTYNSTATVTLANQAAINAIRLVDVTHLICIESDQFSGLQNFANMYGANPLVWWSDPKNLTMVSFHYYQDSDHSGTYTSGWSSSLRTRLATDVPPALIWAQSKNVQVYIGEFGVPNDNSSDSQNWRTDMETFLEYLDTYLCYATQWASGVHYTAITTLEPTSNYTVDQAQMAVLLKHPTTPNPPPAPSPLPDNPPTESLSFLVEGI